MQSKPELPAPPRVVPEWHQPAAPEMGRVEAPSTLPCPPPDGMEDFPEFIQPEGMQTEETLLPKIPRGRPGGERG